MTDDGSTVRVAERCGALQIVPDSSDPDPRPEEPYVWKRVPRSPTEIRSPLGLYVYGAFAIVLGVVMAVGILVVAPEPRPVFVPVFAAVMGLSLVGLGVWGLHVGRRRARWRRELAAWQARHPGAR